MSSGANEGARATSAPMRRVLSPRCAFRFETEGVGFEQLRAALSVAIIVVGSRIPVPAACELLRSVTHERAVSRVLQRLHAGCRDGHGSHFVVIDDIGMTSKLGR